jgi:hypothetical protein
MAKEQLHTILYINNMVFYARKLIALINSEYETNYVQKRKV